MSNTDGGSAAQTGYNYVRLTEDDGGNTPRVYSTVRPDFACGFLSGPDIYALADWSGLRPMTELEYEKACRGPLDPVPNEYAWGTDSLSIGSGLVGTSGSGEEYYSSGNAWVNQATAGACRVGIFARPGNTREESGASYWGIMNLSDILAERCLFVTMSSFTGNHGDGELTAELVHGNANEGWPATTSTLNRSGSYGADTSFCNISARGGTLPNSAGVRVAHIGGRLVRTAP